MAVQVESCQSGGRLCQSLHSAVLFSEFPLHVISLNQCGECLSKTLKFGCTFFCIFCQISDEVTCIMLPVRFQHHGTAASPVTLAWNTVTLAWNAGDSGMRLLNSASALSLGIPTFSRSMPESCKLKIHYKYYYEGLTGDCNINPLFSFLTAVGQQCVIVDWLVVTVYISTCLDSSGSTVCHSGRAGGCNIHIHCISVLTAVGQQFVIVDWLVVMQYVHSYI